jgi:hypothetical protein
MLATAHGSAEQVAKARPILAVSRPDELNVSTQAA